LNSRTHRIKPSSFPSPDYFTLLPSLETEDLENSSVEGLTAGMLFEDIFSSSFIPTVSDVEVEISNILGWLDVGSEKFLKTFYRGN
tara:strand:- start:479 stop:736 length:258 start_codon:yes stop_codon:yes gene_type:complete